MAKFETLDSFHEWLTETGVDISSLDIIVSQEVCNESCTIDSDDSKKVTQLDESVFEIKSLVNQPSIALYENSEFDQNVWFVDDYEFISGACGTNKITFKDSTLYINICENEGSAYADLVCESSGEIKSVRFKLEKSCDYDIEYDMILSS
jgi:hypothetical protein